MTNKIINVLFVVICFTLLQSCTLSVSCLIYNNSGVDIIVTGFDVERMGESKVFRRALKPGKTVRIEKWDWHPISINKGGIVYKYDDRHGVPYEYTGFVGFGPFTKRQFKAQIEPNMKIYLIPINSSFPASEFPAQPDGFPLCPTDFAC